MYRAGGIDFKKYTKIIALSKFRCFINNSRPVIVKFIKWFENIVNVIYSNWKYNTMISDMMMTIVTYYIHFINIGLTKIYMFIIVSD